MDLLPRINGSRPRTNEYIYDGISVLQPEPGQVVYYPIIDGMAEFKLNVNAYSPEYGRSNGGTVMVIGKSGSNEFHGSVFEFFRNEALNARNLFAQTGPEAGVPPQSVRRDVRRTDSDQQDVLLRRLAGHAAADRHHALQRGSDAGAAAGHLHASDLRSRNACDGRSSRTTRFRRSASIRSALRFCSTIRCRTSPGANNFVRTATEPDNQDQADFRVDRYFGEKHRVFGRYTYFRDDDTPVTPLPDGSGSLTSGVIGHAITRGDAFVGDYNWTLSPSTLNQFRVGYSRRDLNQSFLQNGGISDAGTARQIPSARCCRSSRSPDSSRSVRPPPRTPTSRRPSRRFLDTFTLVRGRHTIKFGADIRREALDVLNPPNPTGSFAFTTTGTNSSAVAGSGNALASLLLGQVNAFTIDIQKQRDSAARAHRRVLRRRRLESFAAPHAEHRHALHAQLPVHREVTIRARSSISTRRCWIFRTPRGSWSAATSVPALGLAYRIGDSWVIRSGYGMIFFEQSGITTPFTIPQFPFVQTVGQQSQDNVNAAFALSSGPTVQVTRPNPNSGLGQGVFGVDRNNGSGYSQQWNFTVRKTFGDDWNVEVAYLGSKNTRLGIPDANINQLPSQYLSLGAALLTQSAESVLRTDSGVVVARGRDDRPTAAAAAVPALHHRGAVPRQRRQFHLQCGRRETGKAVVARPDDQCGLHLLQADRRCVQRLLADHLHRSGSEHHRRGGCLQSPSGKRSFERRYSARLCAGWVYDIPRLWKISGWQIAGLVRVQAGDAVPVTQATNNNSSLGFAVQRPNRIGDPNRVRRAAAWRSTSIRRRSRRAAVRDRQQLAQSGARTGTAECGPDDRQDVSDHGAG